ncbi:MAG: hypothetical protein JWN70_5581 [Planctomycetaceae bacterium]|nr:hypothetical protein [Planctomycetaceae bacterium]
MTHPSIDRVFDCVRDLQREIQCGDLYLRSTLLQYSYCGGNPDYVTERTFLDAELSTPEMLERLRRAIDDDDEVLRTCSARRLVATRQPSSEEILLRFMNSDYFYDRMQLASRASLFHTDEIDRKVISLATSDPSPYVRAAACEGLLGKDPRAIIPVLMQVMQETGEDIDPDDMVPPPSEVAATILDEVLESSFIATRIGNEFATFPSRRGGRKALLAKANKVLKALNQDAD